jgi:murein DD-endopeptidase MepM/ murein hydrolase activator NlpD
MFALLILLLPGCTGARVISDFGSLYGPEGYPRIDGPHNGIDVAGVVGAPVLAIADGIVVIANEDAYNSCGTMVRIRHRSGYSSTYCHLLDITVASDSKVKRGDTIGHLGTSGRRAGLGFEHVHLSITQNGSHVDPAKIQEGCFEPGKVHQADHLGFTFPVQCKD